MKKILLKVLIGGMFMAGMSSCEVFRGPDRTGEIRLSSQLFGANTYYLFGFHFEDAEYYKLEPDSQRDPVPDIINEPLRVLRGEGVIVVPIFTTPTTGEKIGFARIGEFSDLEDARAAYDSYGTVGNDLQFEISSDTVELYQVWVQKTAAGNYVKMLVKDILFMETESGSKYTEVLMDYTYQPNGSSTFPE